MVDGFEGEFSWKRFLFGSIRKKLTWVFGVFLILLIAIVLVTYTLNQQISTDQNYIREVNVPLELMVEQVKGYDAILTGEVHESLLHVEKGDFDLLKEHKTVYDDIGAKLDNLLKVEALALVNKSRRSVDDKNKVYTILSQLDQVNLKLVDLETGAFNAMAVGDVEKARSLVVTTQYMEYKDQLANLYAAWEVEEAKVAEQYRQRLLTNSKNVQFYNLFLGAIFILLAAIVPFFVIRSISNPVGELTGLTREIEKGNFKVRSNIKTGDELEELGNAFNKSTEQLQKMDNDRGQIDKAKTEFLSITSHELRSPMTPMKAQLQMVLGNYFGKLNKEQQESLKIVLNNTERLDKIIVDFLEISRIEAARLKFNFIRADLTKTIGTVIEEMKGFMPEKKIQIVSHIEKLPTIEVDPDRVSQVLRNLINNAIKFTPDNGKIEVSAKLSAGMILFSVKDSGIGIASQAQRKLFEPFYQVDNMYQHKSGGTGLGLAICKGIVESQGGKIWLVSTPDRGTNFYFTIPLRPVREVKAIKLLFSDVAKTDEEIKKLFIEFIGPLGVKEFEQLRDTKGITVESITDYLSFLSKHGIIKKEKKEEFKNKFDLILIGKTIIKETKLSGKNISDYIKKD